MTIEITTDIRAEATRVHLGTQTITFGLESNAKLADLVVQLGIGCGYRCASLASRNNAGERTLTTTLVLEPVDKPKTTADLTEFYDPEVSGEWSGALCAFVGSVCGTLGAAAGVLAWGALF